MKIRIWLLSISFFYLFLAVASKFYTGPFEKIATIYLGDLFIVGWLYFFVVAICPVFRPLLTGGIVFALSVLAELFQATGIPSWPGIPSWIVFWTGSVFDPIDILVYAVGVLLAISCDVFLRRTMLLDGR